MSKDTKGMRTAISLVLACLFLMPECLAFLPAAAQTDPPPFGGSQWVINDNTLIKDKVLRQDQNIVVNGGGTLTLDNSTLVMQATKDYVVNISVKSGGSLIIKNGSYLGAFDAVYFVYLYPGSKARISNSTISRLGGIAVGGTDVIIEDTVFKATLNGMSSSYGVVIWKGKAVLRRDTIYQGNFGVWNLYGDVEIYDSIFDGVSVNVAGENKCGDLTWPWVPPWDLPGERCSLPRNIRVEGSQMLRTINWGLESYASFSTVRNTTFKESAGFGVFAYSSAVPAVLGSLMLVDNTFENMSYGIDVERDSSGNTPYVILINNDFLNCYKYGVRFVGASGQLESWTISRPVRIDSSVSTRTRINIASGGTLTLLNTDLTFNTPNILSTGLTVEGGGMALLDNMTYGPSSQVNSQVYLKVLKDGMLTVRNSKLDKVGYGWGTSGEIGGIYSEGETLLSDVTLTNAPFGVITNGGYARVQNTSISGGVSGLNAVSGHLEAFDTDVSNMTFEDVHAWSGQADLYNLTFNKMKVNTDPGGQTQIFWRCDLGTMWQNGRPLGGVDFNISEASGPVVASGTTDQNGTSGLFFLRESIDSGSGTVMKTPHKVFGRWSDLGLWNTTNITVDHSMRLMFYLLDNITPSINVTSPGLVAYQRNNTLKVNGTARDRGSGLDRVEWSYDLDLWYPATGLDKWNFTVSLPYGTTIIYIRAVDRAGNERILTMYATIDKDPPYLVLIQPHSGFVTALGTVLVEGLAEMGSEVKAGPISVRSLDGTFRLTVPLDEGVNDLVVSATAPSGLKNSTTVRVIRDSTPPHIIIESPHQDYVTKDPWDKVLTIIGHTEPNATFRANGKLIPLGPDGGFRITVDIAEGLNVISFVASDNVGNQNSSVLRVVYDTKAPGLSVYSPSEGAWTNRTAALVSGLTEPGMNVTAFTQNGTAGVYADSEGGFELLVGLAEGANNLTVMARDEAGNTKSVSLHVTRDTVPPKITVTNANNGMVVQDTKIFIEGQTETGSKIKVNGDLVDPGYTGQFSKWVDLPSSDNAITFEAVDKAGNKNVLTIHIMRKPHTGPTNPGLKEGPDYFPWIAVIVIALVVVEIALVARYQRNKVRAKASAEAAKDLVSAEGNVPPGPAKGGPRVAPRRGGRAGRPEEGAVLAREQEFEIEYGNGRGPQGGGQQ
jgi:hypothetical protein